LQAQISTLNTALNLLTWRLNSAEYKIVELQEEVASLKYRTQNLLRNSFIGDLDVYHTCKFGALPESSMGHQMVHVYGDSIFNRDVEIKGSLKVNNISTDMGIKVQWSVHG
jgi:hypothetical protein